MGVEGWGGDGKHEHKKQSFESDKSSLTFGKRIIFYMTLDFIIWAGKKNQWHTQN